MAVSRKRADAEMATILVVDDRATNREFLVTLLAYYDHRVLEARDGAEALEVAGRERPDLMITDILMPTMDGYELVRRLRSASALASTQVIFYTAHFNRREAERLAEALSVRHILTKPAEPELVVAAVTEALSAGAVPPEARQKLAGFTDEHVRVMRDKLAATVDALSAANARLHALLDAILELASQRDPKALLNAVCRHARELVTSRYGMIVVTKRDDRAVILSATTGMGPAWSEGICSPDLAGGLIARAYRERQSARVARVEESPAFFGLPERHPPFRNLLVAPVASPSTTYGWIALSDRTGADEFSHEDERLLQMLAAEVGRIYENASLYTELVAQTEQLRAQMAQRAAAQDELRQSEQHNRAWFEHAPIGIVQIDRDGRFTQVNPETCDMLGYRCEALVGRPICDVTAAVDRVRTLEILQKLARSEADRLAYESRYVHRDGSQLWVHITLSVIRDAAGRRHHYVGIIEAIGRRKETERALKETKEQFEQLANHIPEAFWIADIEKRAVIYVSPAFERIHGAGLDSSDPKRAWTSMLHSLDRRRVLKALRKVAETPTNVKYRIVRPDGGIRWVHARGYPIKNADGTVYRVAGTIEDITERRALEGRLQHQAHFDSLTGLPNRVLFFDRLAQALTHALRAQHSVGLLFVDLDNFKTVNDTMGHSAGDKLLAHIGQGLKHAMRAEDTVGRLGGDEFGIILPQVDKPDHARVIAEKALAALTVPLNVDGQRVVITGSIGLAISVGGGIDAETLVKNADRAMFRAKESGRNGYAFYTEEMNKQAAEQRDLERLLRRALECDEFSLHFQAKASIKSGEVTGCEALLRWPGAGGGPIGPAQFVPVLEQSGLIVQVGERVIRKACQQIAEWKLDGIAPLPIAINVSPRQFHDRNLAGMIESALRDMDVDGSFLEVELTESTAMQNTEETIRSLHKLKELGVKIAIDDFGTGYSSLSYLTQLPIDVLKIDRAFVTGIPDNRSDASIAKAIITMAHSLFLKVVAEGVEHERQLDFLAENGCDEVQGYLLARPVPALELTRLMRTDGVMLHAHTVD
jgi:diguanylate cyclase